MNKKHIAGLVFTLALSFCSTYAFGAPNQSGINWRTDLKLAAEEAAKSNKPLVVKVGASWCGYCVKMDRTTFVHSGVIERLNQNFIAVNIDADRNPGAVRQVGAQSFPTTLIMSADLTVIKHMSGYRSANQLVAQLDSVRSFIKTTSLEKDKSSPTLKFDGYCLVSLLDDREYKRGLVQHTTVYRDHLLRFASAEHKRRFLERPERFWPANNGISPVAIERKGKAQPGSPQLAMIFRDQLYFFTDRQEQDDFRQDPKRFVSKPKSSIKAVTIQPGA